MNISNCIVCQKEVMRRGSKIGTFCSMKCKVEFQLTQKPVDKDWLIQKYQTEGLSTYQIGKIVHRNPKRVWEWLREYNIPTRTRAETLSKNSYGHLERLGLVENPFKNKKHTDATRKVLSQKASVPKPHLRGKNNGMFGVKGKNHPNWKGGLTPERQQFYISNEWKMTEQEIYKRDRGLCRHCGIAKDKMHIHHKITFQNRETRALLNNLVLLCKECHQWVHSKNNIHKDYLGEVMS